MHTDERYLADILDNVNDLVVIMTPELRCKFMNSSARQTAKISSREVSGKICHEALFGDSPCPVAAAQCPAAAVVKTGLSQTTAIPLTLHDDIQRLFEITASPIKDETGNIVEVVEVFRDISDSVHSQRLLLAEKAYIAQQEQTMKTLRLVERAKNEWETSLDCVDDCVILVDGQNLIKRCNKRLTELTGRTYQELLGCNFKEEVLHEFEAKMCIIDEKGCEYFHAPTGQTFLKRHYPLSSTHGHGEVITLHDITDRKDYAKILEQKNNEIKANAKNLERALAEVSVMIRRAASAQDASVYFTLPPNMSQCWKEMECTQKDCPCYGREPLQCWTVAGDIKQGDSTCFMTKNGTPCQQCQFFKNSTIDPVYRIGMQFNHMMRILENKNKELAAAYDSLKATQAQLLHQEKMASVGQLAAGVAHEINNPIGFVTSNLNTFGKYLDNLNDFIALQSKTLAKVPLTDAQRAAVNTQRKKMKVDFILEDISSLLSESLSGVQRVKEIVANLKNFSHLDQTQHTMANVNDCLHNTLNILASDMKDKVVIREEYGDISSISCSPQELNQAFMNLLINSVESVDEKGEILVRTKQDQSGIHIEITDNGRGIPQDELKKIFEPFYTTKRVGDGTGLGLSIAYDIITNKHSGEISATSKNGQGTTITIKLPLEENK